MTKLNSRKMVLALAASSVLVPAGLAISAPAMAQTASEDTSGDTIIVSARRRDESLQDVPLAVSVVSDAKLDQIGAIDITDVQRLVPNSTIEVARGSNSTLIAFMRGVGQQDPLWGFEPGVGLYVDDVYIARPQGAVLDLFDVERIEVLRGPQGTLYGRNTIGGAIKYVTKDLDLDQPQFTGRINFGSYGQFDQIVSGSYPLSPTFAVGGALANYKRDGYGTNLTTGAQHYNKDIIAGRLSARWKPSDMLDVKFAYDKTQDDSNAKHGHRLLPGNVNGEPVTSNIYDTRAGLGDENSVEAEGFALTAAFDVNDNLTIKSITAKREDSTVTPIDFDALEGNDFDVPAIYDNEQFTQEFLAEFDFGKVTGVGGVYYMDGQYSGAFDVILGNFGVNAPTVGDVSKESLAFFADATIELTDQFSVSLGGRYTEDDTTATVIRETYLGTDLSPYLGGPDRAPFAVSSDFTSSRTDDKFTPRVSLNFEPSSDLSLYASYSEGFKSGGFDPRGNAGLDETSITYQIVTEGFEPEIVKSYEIGAKGVLADGKLNYAAAIFMSDYTDQQITVQTSEVDPVTGFDTFVSTVLNAGESEYTGFELEGVWSLNDIFSVDFMLGYIDAEIKRIDTVIPDPNTGDPVTVNIADQYVVQNTPEWTGRVGLTAQTAAPGNNGDLTYSLSAAYRDEYNLFNVDNEGSETDPNLPANTPPLDPDAYTLIDASVIWDVDDNWQLSLVGRNLTDEEYKVAGYNFAGSAQLGVDGVYSAFYGAPRTVTASLKFKY